MEAAAKQVKLLSQRILPDRPHHLSFSPDIRYKVSPDAQAPEEHIHRRLQYMTFISNSDRGVLLTRPYYDMREEPPTPSVTETATSSRSDKKPATKMSLSDYKNKVNQKSQSPLPASGIRPKKPEENAARSTQERKDDGRQSEMRKKDTPQPAKELRRPGSRDPLFNDRPSSLPPKPPPVRGPSPSPAARKRGSDEDETSRPAKRAKADINGAPDDKTRGQKDNAHPRGGADIPRKNDSPATASNGHERTDGKAGTSASSSAMNGRSMLKAAMSSAQNGSPNVRSRAGSLNGSRGESGGSSKSTPVKAPLSSSGAKAAVPPLLSPLHLPFDGRDTPKKAGKAPRKEEESENQRPTAKGKSERTGATKKAKSPLMIPPLLSPTLPPAIEEELLRRKKTGSKTAGSKSPEHSKSLKRPQVASKDVEKPKRERFMVTLKYPKRLSRQVRGLLASPTKHEKPGTAEQQQPLQTSKKRSLQSGGPPEISGEALNISVVGAKRPRKLEEATAAKAAPPPSTPSRPPSAMGHVDTPGEGGPGSSSQASQSHSGGQSAASATRLRQRGERYRSLGTKLKHARDAIAKRFPANQLPDAEHRLAIITGIEATLSYMIGFRSFTDLRRTERKSLDVGVWRTLLPFVTELQSQAKKLPFVYALALILHDLILQEMLTCWYFGDLRSQGAVSDLQQTGTAQFTLRNKLLRVYKQAEEPGLKLPALNAGVPFDEGICKALEAVTAWAEREGLEWRAALSIDEVLAGN